MTILSVSIFAQTWKARIESINKRGTHITKTLVMRPNHEVNITSTINPAYSRPLHYNGIFLGGSYDSITINLTAYSKDINQSTYLKRKDFPGIEDYNRDNITIALSDISYLNYKKLTKNTESYLSGGIMLTILASLAAMAITPLFCINYKDCTFNTGSYKKWAVGGAIGLAFSVTIVFTVNKIDDRVIYFKPGKQDTNINVWNFKNDP